MGPYGHGNWGVVQMVPNGFPEWRGDARWDEATARALALKYEDIDRCRTILRVPGRRHYAVKSGTTNSIVMQFDRIKRGH